MKTEEQKKRDQGLIHILTQCKNCGKKKYLFKRYLSGYRCACDEAKGKYKQISK